MEYELFHKNIKVAQLEYDPDVNKIKDIINVVDRRHLPVGVQNSEVFPLGSAMQFWWQNRLIPKNRARVLLENPGMTKVIKYSYGFNLTDHYWIKAKHDDMTWDKGNFFTNSFNEDLGKFIVSGKASAVLKMSSSSPDLFSNGEQDKRWMILKNVRTLVKYGRPPYYEQPFNEVLASEICRRLGIPHISYKFAVKGSKFISIYSLCPCFASETIEFVPAGYVQYVIPRQKGESEYAHLIKCCKSLGMNDIDLIERNLGGMMVLDYITANQDRHFGNFGFLRDSESLEWKGLVPNFDSGNAMFYEYPTSDLRKSKSVMDNVPCKSFATTQKLQLKKFANIMAKSNFDFGKLKDIELFYESILCMNPKIDTERRELLSGFLRERINMINNTLCRNNPVVLSFKEQLRKIREDDNFLEKMRDIRDSVIKARPYDKTVIDNYLRSFSGTREEYERLLKNDVGYNDTLNKSQRKNDVGGIER
ncbi:MAG: hypothetical protein K6G80_10695 [Treponema sp.]|nr:hypothetical protein [Treponema sp.]